jgi:AraC-like DNA-binding protein
MTEASPTLTESSPRVRRHSWDRALSLTEVSREMEGAFGFGSLQISALAGAGEHIMTLRYAELGPVMISDAVHKSGVRVQLGDRRSCYQLVIPLNGRLDSRYLGTNIALTRRKSLLYRAQEPVTTWAGTGSRLVGVRFPVHHVHRALEAQLGEPVTRPIAFAPAFDQTTQQGTDLVSMLLEMNERLWHDDSFLLNPLVALPYVESLTQALLLASDHPYREMLARQAGGLVRPSAVRIAADLMETEPGRPLTVAALAAEAHVSVRALQEGFQREFGMTPMTYLREVRLRRARADLLAADRSAATVASVARRWGFPHPSRFAARYAAAFGEPPSATLRKRR